ncbi:MULTISPECIES: 3-dehydroquinate synthase family protein [unclassified Oceanispirochaeta]|uniref:3-dehydroquinate synthase n=1 Tax=unclassified Oceanispirochaeta TaxID=2635722 RepID=UPI000E08F673|nr:MULTISPECIES: 3-dehydroquinate synthase family protein [unclassified Oceanispirochaeta]MBF9016493.1 3-dehydroquinate synthase [Oceanispirochaeta sp. M2]NPD72955.1 3-dehydroquinate synthase [Oceanispirochaeta sp. M1]RDG31529.1 3-dehydroquinate synthase [Oceanispirochaeta sp. M1]
MELIKDFTFGGFPCRAAFYNMNELFPQYTALFVADSNTESLISRPSGVEQASGSRYETGIDSGPLPEIILTPGEEGKQWPAVDSILKLAMKKGLARDSIICGAGGGVVTDMTAFAGSLYMRGCRVILIPTSLLSMVDAALGGKTGIDAGVYKNMIGSFYPAEEVRICPEILKTLPEAEYWAGMGEVIKTAIIGDAELMDLIRDNKEALKARDPEILKDIIRRCMLVKGALVEEDLREKGRRAYLNLGHTFGHALEAVSEFRWAHGLGVVWGMGKALDASVAMGLAHQDWAESLKELFRDLGYKLDASESPEAMLRAMQMDKKKKGGRLRYIIPAGPQDIRIEYLEPEFVLEILKSGR